jgi:hypothetical protein
MWSPPSWRVTFLPGASVPYEGHAWKNVDARPSGSISSPCGARAVTLFSFERPARHALLAGVPAAIPGRRVDARYLEGHGPAHLENCIVESGVLYQEIKRTRAHGGCLGTKSRRRTWAAAISLGELLNER